MYSKPPFECECDHFLTGVPITGTKRLGEHAAKIGESLIFLNLGLFFFLKLV